MTRAVLLLVLVAACVDPTAPPADAGLDLELELELDAGVDARDYCATCCVPSNQDSANCCALVEGGAAACPWSR